MNLPKQTHLYGRLWDRGATILAEQHAARPLFTPKLSLVSDFYAYTIYSSTVFIFCKKSIRLCGERFKLKLTILPYFFC
jgi:hypothetical protein